MPGYYDANDIRFNWAGDFQLGDDRDLATSFSDPLTSLYDQIHDVLASSFESWELYPNRGAGLNDFIGEPNTKETARAIHDRIRVALTSTETVRERDLNITVIPVHIHKMLINISVSVMATEVNGLIEGDTVRVSVVFDTIEQEVFFLSKTPLLIQR